MHIFLHYITLKLFIVAYVKVTSGTTMATSTIVPNFIALRQPTSEKSVILQKMRTSKETQNTETVNDISPACLLA